METNYIINNISAFGFGTNNSIPKNNPYNLKLVIDDEPDSLYNNLVSSKDYTYDYNGIIESLNAIESLNIQSSTEIPNKILDESNEVEKLDFMWDSISTLKSNLDYKVNNIQEDYIKSQVSRLSQQTRIFLNEAGFDLFPKYLNDNNLQRIINILNHSEGILSKKVDGGALLNICKNRPDNYEIKVFILQYIISAKDLFEDGQKFLCEGNYDNALNAFDACINKNSKHYLSYLHKAYIFENRNKRDDALELFTNLLLKFSGDEDEIYTLKGRLNILNFKNENS